MDFDLKLSDKALASKGISPQLKLVLGIFWSQKSVSCKEIRSVLPVSRSMGFDLAKAFNALSPIYRTANKKSDKSDSPIHRTALPESIDTALLQDTQSDISDLKSDKLDCLSKQSKEKKERTKERKENISCKKNTDTSFFSCATSLFAQGQQQSDAPDFPKNTHDPDAVRLFFCQWAEKHPDCRLPLAPELMAEQFVNYWEDKGWTRKTHQPIKNTRLAVSQWCLSTVERQAKAQAQAQAQAERRTAQDDIDRQIAKEVMGAAGKAGTEPVDAECEVVEEEDKSESKPDDTPALGHDDIDF